MAVCALSPALYHTRLGGATHVVHLERLPAFRYYINMVAERGKSRFAEGLDWL